MPPSASMANPNSLPSWPTRICNETPLRKPTKIGFERKSARAPSRRKLAPMQKIPARTAIEHGQRHVQLRIAGGQRCDSGSNQGTGRRIRTDYQLPGSTEQGIGDHRQDGRIQTDDRAEPGQLGIGDPNRQGHGGNRQAGNQVMGKIGAPVAEQCRQTRGDSGPAG